jgi:Protein of unknown function (DUF1566)
MLKYTKTTALVCLLGLMPVIGNSQTCKQSSIPATTPTSQFIDNADGTVTDKQTGLMWKRCGEGQTWVNATCIGNATGYTWQAALLRAQSVNSKGGFAGQVDWRVPNIKELRSITERQCTFPVINLTVFPRTAAVAVSSGSTTGIFWSSSPVTDNPQDPWAVDFSYGDDFGGNKDDYYHVRLVRSGQ